ncbi:hypothetical protein [Anaeromyxobacter sp. SG64]|uniref:hypothetical protein n=1 Tax=Anaeromyxobacter sp. SG64 TaxID=2925409 RepID=UPI001F57F775|nr:hypothetical protein [Anaeromyxobacter sp. SG64]
MRKTIAALSLAVLASACGKQDITPDEARSAVPESSAIRIDTPKDSADASSPSSPAALTATAEATFDARFPALTTSDYARWSYVTAWTVNGGAWWTLATLRLVTLLPPTACSGDTCTWGPWDEESKVQVGLKVKRWQLVVTKVEEGKFTYELSAMNLLVPGPFLSIVSGVAEPAGPGRGKGQLTVSFDNARQLPESEQRYGTLTIQYDTTAEARVDAQLAGGRDEQNGNPLDAAYAFVATGAGGDLQVAFRGQDPAANPVNLSLHARWDGTGAGRGDARVFAEDVNGSWTFDYGASECWAGKAGAFALTYDTDPAFGDVSACASAFQGEPQYSTLGLP